jgi:N-acetylmuramoyl-L-alanine amidase
MCRWTSGWACRATRPCDLFISIHADTVGAGASDLAQTVRGATVYVLSEKASSREAERLADKENASDVLAGVDGRRRRRPTTSKAS